MQYEPAGLTTDPDVPRVTSLSDYLTQPPAVVDLTETASQVIRLPEQHLRKHVARGLTSVAR